MNHALRAIGVGIISISIAGCAASLQITNTQRSTIEQRLLVKSLERALSGLNITPLQSKTVAIDFYGLTSDADFAKEFFIAWLQSQQVRVASEPQKAQLHLKVFAQVLGVDKGGAFVGIPALSVPVVSATVPELALFKSETHQGGAEIQVYTVDRGTGKFVDKSALGSGQASYNQYTILILIHFTRSDLDEKKIDEKK